MDIITIVRHRWEKKKSLLLNKTNTRSNFLKSAFVYQTESEHLRVFT